MIDTFILRLVMGRIFPKQHLLCTTIIFSRTEKSRAIIIIGTITWWRCIGRCRTRWKDHRRSFGCASNHSKLSGNDAPCKFCAYNRKKKKQLQMIIYTIFFMSCRLNSPLKSIHLWLLKDLQCQSLKIVSHLALIFFPNPMIFSYVYRFCCIFYCQ